ncbi:ClpP/crotonase-like domain-containing protein [Tricladium varicosporioides]|nr:ClpP/crotonase-like domain-containing protein [Hymenoscyphus varicosporioides]
MDFSSENSLIQVTVEEQGVALLKINRPEKRNALSQQTIDTLVSAIAMVEKDEKVKVAVLTGNRVEGPFSAGADLYQLLHLSTADAHKTSYLKDLSDAVTHMRKPIIACVSGFALGGGFELAMMCDMIYAADDAIFGLPELSVGTIPGAGGTQRLARALGKQKAMDMILTSKTITGKELCHFGLVSRTFNVDHLLWETLEQARLIASRSAPVVQLAKEAILNAEQTDLDAGIKLERALYYSSFALQDRTEGMVAFVEKRKPVFKDK